MNLILHMAIIGKIIKTIDNFYNISYNINVKTKRKPIIMELLRDLVFGEN